MSDKTKSVKSKHTSDEEAREYMLEFHRLENEKSKLEEQKASYTKSLNNKIKGIEAEIERMVTELNDGVVITVYNYMNKETQEIDWKDEGGNIIMSTPFDEDDWRIYDEQAQKTLFPDEEQMTTVGTYPTRQELPSPAPEDVIDVQPEGEDNDE